jgi:hypothetical protein
MSEPAEKVLARGTGIGVAATHSGPFTVLAQLVGDIPLPKTTWKVGKPLTNADTHPLLLVDPVPEVGDVTAKVMYTDHSAAAALRSAAGAACYILFVLTNGDWFKFFGAITEVGEVTGVEELACCGEVTFAFSHFVDSGTDAQT